MSILAEPRRKQRISVDPQNVNWHRNQDKFGQKMLEKMGWQEGKGLGRNEQGITQNIALKANHTAKGLGCELKHDKTWIAHHDDFATLLASLNEKSNSSSVVESSEEDLRAEKISIEEKSKNSKARIHYHRFARGKDLSRCTEQDKAAIFGTFGGEQSKKQKRSKPVIAAEEEVPQAGAADGEHKCTENTKVSTLSLNDYFAAKLAKMGNLSASLKSGYLGGKKESKAISEDSDNESDASVPRIGFSCGNGPKESKKQKREVTDRSDEEPPAESQVVELSKEERRRRKRERRAAEAAAAEAADIDHAVEEADETPLKRKKKKCR